MLAPRSLADLANTLTSRIIDVVDCEHVVGRVIAHESSQFDAFDLAGRPLGTFAELAAAESAVRASGAENYGGAD